MVAFNNYWFFLEPTTFIFQDSEKYLLYNSESGFRIIVKKSNNLDLFFSELQNQENPHCVNLEDLHSNEDVMSLVEAMKDKYMGDIIVSNTAPVVIPPIFKCHADKPENDLFYIEGASLMPLLNNVTFYLNGTCTEKCPHCPMYYKQFDYCHKSNNELSLQNVLSKIEHCISTSSVSLNFCGGNIFLYSNLNLLLEYLDTKNLKSNFYFNYLNWNEKYKEYFLHKSIYYNVFVHFPYNKAKFSSLLLSMDGSTNRIRFIFIVVSEEEYLLTNQIIEEHKLTWFIIKPFYNKQNLSFFKENIYLDTIELSESSPSKHDIYKRQQINMFDFGKLIIDSSGYVFANFNHPQIGNINENLPEIIKRELQNGKSWKRTRNQKPCNKCIYQYICPSPSNYELIINQNNLCNIKL